jgi:hypothetical protein
MMIDACPLNLASSTHAARSKETAIFIRRSLRWMRIVLVMAVAGLVASGNACAFAQEDPQEDAATVSGDGETMDGTSANVEDAALWQYRAELKLPQDANPIASSGGLMDAIVGPDIFSVARFDLIDLRLFDAAGTPYPCVVRIRNPVSIREEITLKEFNRLEPEDGTQELALELISSDGQHNEVLIETTGDSFRRSVKVDGSDDGQRWRPLTTGQLLRFNSGDQKIDVKSLTYAESRFQYIRVRVQPDAQGQASDDGSQSPDRFTIENVKVLRTAEIEGERSQWDVTVGPREPTRVYGVPGSVWILELNGQNIPCDRLDVEIADNEFARDVQIQVEQPSSFVGRPVFTAMYSPDSTTWQRTAGEEKRTMSMEFSEVQASRLRLMITDYQNKPLTIKSAKVSAAARQIVFQTPAPEIGKLQLYAGNANADSPGYDFARNLPQRLDPPPSRVEIASVEVNPDYVPPPVAFSERFPWLIYVVLGAVCVVLLGIIASLAQKTLALHDVPVEDVPA